MGSVRRVVLGYSLVLRWIYLCFVDRLEDSESSTS